MISLDTQQILSTAQTIALGTPAIWFYTELAKKLNSVTWLKEGQKTRLRTFAGLLSAVAAVIGGVASGTLDFTSIQDLAVSLITAGAVWSGAHAVHSTVGGGNPANQVAPSPTPEVTPPPTEPV